MSRRIRLPAEATEEEVYELSLKYVKWLLITQQVDVATKIKAVQMGMRLRPAQAEVKVGQIEDDMDRLVRHIFTAEERAQAEAESVLAES